MPKNNNNNNNNSNNTVMEMKRKVELMEARIKNLESANSALETKVAELDSRLIVSERVSERLSLELDRLDQYHRRSNVVVKGMFLPERETNEDVERNIHKILKDDLKLPEAIQNIDKLHRVGKVKERNGKKIQDVIIRFKTHRTRYAVYSERKKAKNVKISSNLTKKRGKLLYDASTAISEIDKVKFCFSNIHGDLNIMLAEPFNGRSAFSFRSMGELNELLIKMNLTEESIV